MAVPFLSFFSLVGFFFQPEQYFSLTTIQPEQCFSASFSQNYASRTRPLFPGAVISLHPAFVTYHKEQQQRFLFGKCFTTLYLKTDH